ncbi:MAG TPA: VOC family protein [Dehalococcoidia bacterium]|nr:VOC family protein [Dehalococcoidia bacterium]
MPEIRPEYWVDDPGEVVRYYQDVLGFNKRYDVPGEGGKIVHAEIDFQGSNAIMIAIAQPGRGSVDAVIDKLNRVGPAARGAGVLLYIDIGDMDIDKYYADVVAKGAKIIEPLQDQFFGDRTFRMEDPFGYVLTFARRMAERH